MNNTPPLDTWTTEEHTKDTLVPTFDAQGRPTGLKPGTTTVKEKVAYTQLIPHQVCPNNDHFFLFANGGRRDAHSRLQVECTRCSVGGLFLLGIDKLIDGKIVRERR